MSDDLWRTAVHEAGHAVMHFALGIPVGLVSIVPDTEQLGVCRSAAIPDPEAWTPDESEGQAAAFLAGGLAAEMAGLPDPWAGADGDIDNALSIASGWFDSEAFGDRARIRAMGILRENWPAVEAVAWSLVAHRSIAGPELERLCSAAGMITPREVKA